MGSGAGIVQALVSSALLPEGAPLSSRSRRLLTSASRPDWEWAFDALAWHRLLPLAFRIVSEQGLDDAVPDTVRTSLNEAHRRSLVSHGIHYRWLERVLERLEAEGVEAVVWKGAALGNLLYPDAASRQIGDLDLLVRAGERAAAEGVLAALGFTPERPSEAWDEDAEDGCNWRHVLDGIVVDIHHRCRLFEAEDEACLRMPCRPRFLALDRIWVYEPNAMLVHLVTHLHEHRVGRWGYFLPWLVDIGLVLQAWGDSLDGKQLERLLPTRKARFWLLRTCHFLARELEAPAPPFLAKVAAEVPTFTFAEALRSRRMQPWGLPGARGWARIAARSLGLRTKTRGPRLRASDPFLWLVDRARESLAESRPLPGLSGARGT